ncbi:MAG: hypothetical protein U0353_13440 [Sandaracinus sp.]
MKPRLEGGTRRRFEHLAAELLDHLVGASELAVRGEQLAETSLLPGPGSPTREARASAYRGRGLAAPGRAKELFARSSRQLSLRASVMWNESWQMRIAWAKVVGANGVEEGTVHVHREEGDAGLLLGGACRARA